MRRWLRIGLMTMILTVPGALSLAAPMALAADPVIAAVGDLGCGPNDPSYNNGEGTATDCRQRYVSDLLVAAQPAAALLLGDTQYETGQLANFNAVFHPTYGRVNPVAYPVPGNVEYDDGFTGAEGYFNYFTSAGVQGRIAASGNGGNVHKGYYSFDVGNWHIIGLNSNCSFSGVGGCGPGSPQETWLREDLAANRGQKCVLAFAHHARWNSGTVFDDGNIATFWEDLHAAQADVFLSGHANHHYERHAPQDPDGNADANGIRQFIVSTGGEHHGTPPGSPGNTDTLEVANYSRFGILKLTLHPTSYDWQFVQDAGTTPPPAGPNFTDSGTGTCNAASAPTPGSPGSPGGPGSSAPATPTVVSRAATELNITRSTVVRSRRTLELNGAVRGQATGRIGVALAAAGRTTKVSAPIRDNRLLVRKRIPTAQARLGTGLVTITYRGDDKTRPLSVRLRAGAVRARLKPSRPTISDGRLKAAGTITARARGVVRLQLEFVHNGTLRRLRFDATISNGRWKLERRLSATVMSQIEQRSGTLHSYTLYTGSRSRSISGELRSFKVLPAT